MKRPSRLRLYAVAARNQIGRSLGLASAYTPAQIAAAKTMWSIYAARGWDADTIAACIGCAEGEASLLFPPPKGDHGEAVGAYQWHAIRASTIQSKTGIYVALAGPADSARAFIEEISNHWGAPYDKVEPALVAAATITDKMRVLLSMFERSGNQSRDLARRVPMATAWRDRALQENWSASA